MPMARRFYAGVTPWLAGTTWRLCVFANAPTQNNYQPARALVLKMPWLFVSPAGFKLRPVWCARFPNWDADLNPSNPCDKNGIYLRICIGKFGLWCLPAKRHDARWREVGGSFTAKKYARWLRHLPFACLRAFKGVSDLLAFNPLFQKVFDSPKCGLVVATGLLPLFRNRATRCGPVMACYFWFQCETFGPVIPQYLIARYGAKQYRYLAVFT